jgi:drug/metabolite transporter (DMT)-like permease
MAAIGSLLFAIKFALDIAGPVVPLLFIRVFNAIAFGTLFYAAPTDPRPDPKLVWRVLPIGSMDTAAFVLYNFGIGVGLVSVVSAVSGLYSAVTVFLAWAILRERTSWVQRIALGPVFAGAVLLSIQA